MNRVVIKNLLEIAVSNRTKQYLLIDVGFYLLYHFTKENNLPTPLIKIYKRACLDKDLPNSLGLYHYDKKLIQIFLKNCDELTKDDFTTNVGCSSLSTILHEYGHFLAHYVSIIENIDADVYCKKIYGKLTKQYKYDMSEKFADDFVLFILNPDWLKQFRPLIYNFFINKFKKINGLSYMEIRKIIKTLNNYK